MADRMWRPTNKKYGVAIYNFDSGHKETLKLHVGETVHVFEEYGSGPSGWYRGVSLKNKDKMGIFPACLIHHKPCKVDNPGLYETVEPVEDSMVKEVTYVLQEWARIWKERFVQHHNLFASICKSMKELITLRGQLVAQMYTKEDSRDVKKDIVSIIDWGNGQLGMDVVPRIDGVQVDADMCSITQLHRVHVESAKKAAADKPHQRRLTTKSSKSDLATEAGITTHHLLANFETCSIEDVTESLVGLYHYNANDGKCVCLTEKFLVRFSKGVPEDLDRISNYHGLFMDLTKEDLDKDLFLVAHIYRRGYMKAELAKKAFAKPGLYKRPWGVGVTNLNLDRLPANISEWRIQMRVVNCGDNESHFPSQHEQIMKKIVAGGSNPLAMSASKASVVLAIVVRTLHGDMATVKKEEPLLFSKGVSLVQKLGLSDVITPGEVRNDLYVTLKCAEFDRGNKTAQKNVEVKVTVVDKKGNQIQNCISYGCGEVPKSDYYSAVFYHNNHPEWNETIRFSVPIETFPGSRICFQFYHCKVKRKEVKKPVGFAYFKVTNESQIVIKDDTHELCIYKLDEKHPFDMKRYLQLPFRRDDPNLASQIPANIMFKPTEPEILTISTLLCSGKFTQNGDLLGILNWRGDKFKNKLSENLQKLCRMQGEEIVKFLHDVLDALFDMFNGEAATKDHFHQIFRSLVYVFTLIHHARFETFKPVLEAYISETFASPLIHRPLCVCFADMVDHACHEETRHADTQLIQAFQALDYIFRFIVQSRQLQKNDPFRRMSDPESEKGFQANLQRLFESFGKLLSIKSPKRNTLTNQVSLLTSLHKSYSPLLLLLPESDMANLLKTCLKGMPQVSEIAQDEITKHKLELLRKTVATKLFTTDASRSILLPILLEQVKQCMEKKKEIKPTVNLLGDIMDAMFKLKQNNNIKEHIRIIVSTSHMFDVVVDRVLSVSEGPSFPKRRHKQHRPRLAARQSTLGLNKPRKKPSRTQSHSGYTMRNEAKLQSQSVSRTLFHSPTQPVSALLVLPAINVETVPERSDSEELLEEFGSEENEPYDEHNENSVPYKQRYRRPSDSGSPRPATAWLSDMFTAKKGRDSDKDSLSPRLESDSGDNLLSDEDDEEEMEKHMHDDRGVSEASSRASTITLGPTSPGTGFPGPCSPGPTSPGPMSPGLGSPGPGSPGFSQFGATSPGMGPEDCFLLSTDSSVYMTLEEDGALIACLTDMLRLMDDDHYEMLLHVDHREHMLKIFLINVLTVFEQLVRPNVFPRDWTVMRMVTNNVVFTAIEYFSEALKLHFIIGKKFDPELWASYFNLAVAFITQPSLQLNRYSEAKAQKLRERYQDMRVLMGVQVGTLWQSLGQHKSHFIPAMVGPFLELTLVPEKDVRKATLPIIFDMMECNQKQDGNFKQVEAALIERLDYFLTQPHVGDSNYKDIFKSILLERVQSEPNLRENGTQFILSVTNLLERLLDYRFVTVEMMWNRKQWSAVFFVWYSAVNFRQVVDGEENSDKRMHCTFNILNFYKDEIKREEMYIRYVNKLHELHMVANNHAEAGLTLQQYARILTWKDTMLPAELKYNAERECDRKEMLYTQIINCFDKGKVWEYALPLCKELQEYYEKNLDYKKLGDILKQLACFYQKILEGVPGEDPSNPDTFVPRQDPSYYRVAYYGQSFPAFIRNKQFIYRGDECLKLPTIMNHLTSEFPTAQILPNKSPQNDDIKEGNQQYIQICSVKPIPARRPEFHDKEVPLEIQNFYNVNEIDTFQFDRPYHRDGVADKQNESKTLCLERTKMKTAYKFPGILRWYEVIETEVEMLCPIRVAIDTVLQFVGEFDTLLKRCKTNPKLYFKQLEMRLQGTISAAVGGGITKYHEAYFTDEFQRKHPDEVLYLDELKRLFHEQVDVLKEGMILHGRLVPPDLKPLHDALDKQFHSMRKAVAEHSSPRASAVHMKDRPNTPASISSLSSSSSGRSSTISQDDEQSFLVPPEDLPFNLKMSEKSRRSYVPFPEDASFAPPVPSRPLSMSMVGPFPQLPKPTLHHPVSAPNITTTGAPALPERKKPRERYKTTSEFPSMSDFPPNVPTRQRKGSGESPDPEGRFCSPGLISPTSPNIFFMPNQMVGGTTSTIPEDRPVLPAKSSSPRQSELLNGLTSPATSQTQQEASSPSVPPLPPRKGPTLSSPNTNSDLASPNPPERSKTVVYSRDHRASTRDSSDYQNGGAEERAGPNAPPPLPRRSESQRSQQRDSQASSVASADYTTNF